MPAAGFAPGTRRRCAPLIRLSRLFTAFHEHHSMVAHHRRPPTTLPSHVTV